MTKKLQDAIVNVAKVLITTAITTAIGCQALRYVVREMDPNKKIKDEAQLAYKQTLSKFGMDEMTLNEYEMVMLKEIVSPEDVSQGFADIGGLDDVVQSITENVIYPLVYPEHFHNARGKRVLTAPKGVLLYGPPGCGKTLLAKAIAKESGAMFINLRISTIQDKWFGETSKLVDAVFSVAQKISHSRGVIIFVDEIDSLLRQRRSMDNEASSQIKALFMSLWDGMTTDSNNRVVLIGATNRYRDIDEAILRRMPKRYFVDLPNKAQRKRILEIHLRDIEVDGDFLDKVVELTEGRSGSDLAEICRNAIAQPTLQALRALKPASSPNTNAQGFRMTLPTGSNTEAVERAICFADFVPFL